MNSAAHKCRKPNVVRMDYWDGDRRVENRMCLCCERHWWDGREYTKHEWDVAMTLDASVRQTCGVLESGA